MRKFPWMNLQFAVPGDLETEMTAVVMDVAEVAEPAMDVAGMAMSAESETDAAEMKADPVETDAAEMNADPVETDADGRNLLSVMAEEVQRAAIAEDAAALPTVFLRKSVNEIICATNVL